MTSLTAPRVPSFASSIALRPISSASPWNMRSSISEALLRAPLGRPGLPGWKGRPGWSGPKGLPRVFTRELRADGDGRVARVAVDFGGLARVGMAGSQCQEQNENIQPKRGFWQIQFESGTA